MLYCSKSDQKAKCSPSVEWNWQNVLCLTVLLFTTFLFTETKKQAVMKAKCFEFWSTGDSDFKTGDAFWSNEYLLFTNLSEHYANKTEQRRLVGPLTIY